MLVENLLQGASAQRASATNSSIVSGQAQSDLRRREVVLAKISLYMAGPPEPRGGPGGPLAPPYFPRFSQI